MGVGGKFLDLSLLSESEAHSSICLLVVDESFESLFMVPEGTFLFNIPLVDISFTDKVSTAIKKFILYHREYVTS